MQVGSGLKTLHSAYVALGGFVVFFGLTSLFVKERLYLTESLVATVFGVVLGPRGLGFIKPEVWAGVAEKNAGTLDEHAHFYTIFQEAARVVISFQVMAAGISTPGGFLMKHARSVFMMLGPVMIVMWAISGATIRATLGFSWPESMIIGACVTPTDPVLAMSVIKGKFAERYIPTRLRDLLAVESGANDGLGFPFMMLPLLLILNNMDWKKSMYTWTVTTWIWQICGAIVLGVVIGFTARTLLIQSMKRHLIDKESFLVFSLALALVVTGVGALLDVDDLLAVFIAGNAFAWDDDAFMDKSDESHIHGVIDLVFNITFFVLFGASIPWAYFGDAGRLPRLFACSALILLFRRLPGVALMRRFIPVLQTRKEAFFAGWFGPMGVGAIFFALEARHKLHDVAHDYASQIYPTVSFIVLSSIVIHGVTVPLTNSSLKRRMRIKAMRAHKHAENLRAIIDGSENQSGADLSNGAADERNIAFNDETVRTVDTAVSYDVPLSPADSSREEYIYLTDDEDEGYDGDEDGDGSSKSAVRRRRRVMLMGRSDLEGRGVALPANDSDDMLVVVSPAIDSSAADVCEEV